MEIRLSWFECFVVCILIALPLLYELSATFKYYSKMCLYLLMMNVTAVLLLPVALLRPLNTANFKTCMNIYIQMTRMFGVKVELINGEYLDTKGPYILVCNHQSSLDMIVMANIWPNNCVCMVKKELMYAGPFGLALKLCGAIFVDRRQSGANRQTMTDVFANVKAKSIRVWVFPEGTRNHEFGMLPFKKGAFHLAVTAQIPIVPIVVSSYSEFYSKKESRFGTAHLT
ncbi:PREDICTED: 1-acyl-sn-glycerol-3-phosphate acyltransferase alpha-like [Priapulus caudatus]|uniref:1-acyl-sn-glycerol-3-phosphate acyltransferase n=1 Tax=Priapulus caudatus TaxID=37621 RepID=A0ABM1E238_PRICU|nr:PREDICTED: 1-acyl-sn-glycerol-3-phosphate acyltransferase alpha-like [Priapulus caudatus]